MSTVRIETSSGSGMISIPPPPNDGQRYVFVYDHDTDQPRWHGLAGFGLSYGNNFAGGL